MHVGAYADGTLVGAASVYREAPPDSDDGGAWRLRGMVTLPEARGKGCGGRLLRTCIAYVAVQGGTRLWCNARTTAVDFYRHLGFEIQGAMFEMPDIGPHYFMLRQITPVDKINTL